MAFLLKISCQGHVHQIQFDHEPDYTAFDSAMKGALPTCHAYAAKYTDDEGDLCTLVEPTFPDFLTTARTETSGAVVFHVEALPLPDATVDGMAAFTASDHWFAASDQQPQRSSRRRHQPVFQDAWVDDHRDLDELLQQFEEPVVSKKSNKKKKKKDKKPQQSGEQTQTLIAEDSTGAVAMKDCGEDEGQQHDEGGAADSTVAGPYAIACVSDEGNKGVAGAAVAEETTHDEADMGEAEQETDGEASWEGETEDAIGEEHHEGETEEIEVTLQRASSCPCLSTWQAPDDKQESGSLVAQAWPFIDPEKVSVNFAGAHGPYTGDMGHADPGPPQEAAEAVVSWEPPNTTGYQQVVWMPVLVNWVATA